MRIALLADIHGNSIALDAVLADIHQHGGVDGYWILGDLASIGTDPAGVLERLAALPNAVFIRGNADRYVFTQDRPDPTVEDAQQNPALIPILAEVAGSFAWTQGYLEGTGWLDWLKNLPLEQRPTLPDGTRVLLVHAAPGCDDGDGLNPALNDGELATCLTGCEANLICVGHFHSQMDRRYKQWHIVNPGNVSNPVTSEMRACYAILSADEQGYAFDFRRVAYDRAAAIAAAQKSSNPGVAFVIRTLEGQVRAGWMEKWDGFSHLPTP
ncbi:MAG: metallophosphoesterase family protein [Chloroflexi bacterium]|nr:metallophosphoesterase family protein [Chloroflexota bacterium]